MDNSCKNVREKSLEMAMIYKQQGFTPASLFEMAELMEIYLKGEDYSIRLKELEEKYHKEDAAMRMPKAMQANYLHPRII